MNNFTTADTLSLMLIGFGIVFAVLAVIFVVMLLMKVFFYKEKPAVSPMAPAPSIAPTVVDDEEEIAAVIAAIAMYLQTDPKNIKLKSLTGAPALNITLGGNVNEKLYNKDKWKNV